ncbi:hypothetical protein LWE61_01040 [Sphingobium sufflavum]|uniref:hypothetical protein n=1 Tax=Sphingobium sufflavum TaxID=1129547 RepID=UPI001F3DBEC0|nr:hypothetical protein [Sphingobium sufflavum]MCE7795133.1 hypothetical protein [Sphingobium sufflavum]
MANSYTTEDGVQRTTVIERRSNGGLMIGMIVIIALVAAIAYFLFAQDSREQRQSDALVSAAESVDDAARDAGTAISDAANRAAPKQ